VNVAVSSARVGSLDDPIWSTESDSFETTQPKRAHDRRWAYGVVGLIIAALVGLVLSLALGARHPGGDPGGVIAAEARAAVSEAVPAGSQIVGREVAESQFGACGYTSAGSGWSTVTWRVSFKTSLGDAQVISAVGSRLGSDGWTKTARTSSSATWAKTLGSGSAAKLRLIKGYLISDGWTAWIDAQPQGSNCGGPSTL
jgi:hypothetical protein